MRSSLWCVLSSFNVSQVTSDGRPKILDLLDTSGAGDVAMSEVIPLDSIKGGSLDGLSGRKLQVRTVL